VRSIADAAVWRAMRSPLRFQIFEAIRAAPGSSARDLAIALATTVSRLHYHLRILLEAGLIVSKADGRAGAEAARFSAAFAEYPAGFFGSAEGAEARREQLMHALAKQGLLHASRGRRTRRAEGAARGPVRHFSRLERLDEREVAEVLRHAAEISRIVEAARTRRSGGAPVAAATHFVGVCVTPLRAPALPDAPID
jgi:DNA-binding transcriptional ArsR family regulator